MAINITIEKKHVYIILGLFIVFTAMALVFAYSGTASTTPNPGHTAGDIVGTLGKYIGKTATTYDGNDADASFAGAGFISMDQACASEFTGSHACLGIEAVYSVREGLSPGAGWIISGEMSDSNARVTRNCESWTTQSASSQGQTWSLSIGSPTHTQGGVTSGTCDLARSILCCA